jgi:hypothetical protein
MELVDDLLAREGVLCVSMPERHARACVELIEIQRASDNLRRTGATVRQRIGFLIRGWGLTARLLFIHTRLLELLRVIILRSSSQSWEPAADGEVIFRFER